MFSFMQITFTVARFASTPLLRYFDPATLLTIYGTMCCVFSVVACATGGKAGLASLFIIFFFESIIYPTTFTLATSDMGHLTKRAAGLLCIGVGGAFHFVCDGSRNTKLTLHHAGGAVFPPAQGAMADGVGTQLSYIIPAIGFATVTIYGAAMMRYTANKKRNAVQNVESASGLEKDFGESEKVQTAQLHY